jgi:hypothetical protein
MQKQRRPRQSRLIYGLDTKQMNITLPKPMFDLVDKAPNRSALIREALALYYKHNEAINAQQQQQ